MTKETLYNKTERYLCGAAMPAETRQIQNWLSCTVTKKPVMSDEEKMLIEKEILTEVQAYTAYPLFFPKASVPWWKKMATIF